MRMIWSFAIRAGPRGVWYRVVTHSNSVEAGVLAELDLGHQRDRAVFQTYDNGASHGGDTRSLSNHALQHIRHHAIYWTKWHL